MELRGRSLLKEIDFSAEELLYLVGPGERLRADKRTGRRARRLDGRSIALIFEKTSTRTRSAFEAATLGEPAIGEPAIGEPAIGESA